MSDQLVFCGDVLKANLTALRLVHFSECAPRRRRRHHSDGSTLVDDVGDCCETVFCADHDQYVSGAEDLGGSR
jgi:hypothetical protein